jgi:hypothetical protein
MRETWRRRITVTSSFNTVGNTPHERGGKGGGTHGGNSEEENKGYIIFKYRGENSP